MAGFLERFSARMRTLGGPVRLILIFLLSLFIVAAAFWILDKVILYTLTRSYVDEVSSAFDLNKYLANAILWVTFAIALIFVRLTLSFSKARRFTGWFGILALVVGHSIAL